MARTPALQIPFAAMIAAAVCSCVAPKAVVVEESAPTVAEQEPENEEKPAPEPALAGPPDDGIRLPDMLTLPGENEFRKAPSSDSGRRTGSGAVIARPPDE